MGPFGVLGRAVSQAHPIPTDVNHVSDKETLLEGYSGTQNILIQEHESAAQITHVYQNNNTGNAKLFLMQISICPGDIALRKTALVTQSR